MKTTTKPKPPCPKEGFTDVDRGNDVREAPAVSLYPGSPKPIRGKQPIGPSPFRHLRR